VVFEGVCGVIAGVGLSVGLTDCCILRRRSPGSL
jgi:hypothetical protein